MQVYLITPNNSNVEVQNTLKVYLIDLIWIKYNLT